MTLPSAQTIWQDIEQIRAQSPLIQNITNFVVMNTTANALLALGASPAMVHASDDAADFAAIASALVVNIGTLDTTFVAGMRAAMGRASALGKPIVFDPVGVGATPYRNRISQELLALAVPTIIRGNASEIMALAGLQIQTKGVDSTASSSAAVESARQLSRQLGCVVVVSGADDYVVQGDRMARLSNGHPMMSLVTGMGCTATALTGAFAAINPDPFAAAVGSMAVMGVVGQLAAQAAPGPGTLQVDFLDRLYRLTSQQLTDTLTLSLS